MSYKGCRRRPRVLQARPVVSCIQQPVTSDDDVVGTFADLHLNLRPTLDRMHEFWELIDSLKGVTWNRKKTVWSNLIGYHLPYQVGGG